MLHVCSYAYIHIYYIYIYIMYIYIYRCFVFSHPWAHSQLCASGPAKNNGFYRGAGKRKSADTVGHPGTQTHGGTTWGQNGILILNNPHYTYIYIYVYTIHFWNLYQPCGRNARNSQMRFRGQQLAYSHQNRGLYNKFYIPSRV